MNAGGYFQMILQGIVVGVIMKWVWEGLSDSYGRGY